MPAGEKLLHKVTDRIVLLELIRIQKIGSQSLKQLIRWRQEPYIEQTKSSHKTLCLCFMLAALWIAIFHQLLDLLLRESQLDHFIKAAEDGRRYTFKPCIEGVHLRLHLAYHFVKLHDLQRLEVVILLDCIDEQVA